MVPGKIITREKSDSCMKGTRNIVDEVSRRQKSITSWNIFTLTKGWNEMRERRKERKKNCTTEPQTA